MKRDIRNVIQTLIQKQEAAETASATLESRGEWTTLGVPLIRRDDHHCLIDLTNIHVFRNLHTFVHLLINEVIEQCGFGTADIMVRRKVDPNLTPELAALGLDWVVIYARLDAAEGLPFYHRHFGNCMQVIFRTLQTERWGGLLYPDFFGLAKTPAGERPPALLFPFHLQDKAGESGHYFLVEYNDSGRFLRITIEDATSSRLQMKHIPHRVVDQLVRHSYLPNVYLIAEQIHQGILRECMNSRTEYDEIPAHQRDLFEHLRRSGLPDLQTLHFNWPTDDIQMMLIERQDAPDAMSEALMMLVKELQLLEDPLILSRLVRGDTVEMVSGRFRVFFDVSRFGASLNVSFDESRSVWTLDDYLAKMPCLSRAADQRKGTLGGVRVFLIHHITAEVIGLLKAFQEAGCAALTTFFVKYAGIIPAAYLETLMSLPRETFRFLSLQKIESRQHLAGRYAFSRLFSPLTGLADLDRSIFGEGLDFFGSMRIAAGHLFLDELRTARKKGEVLLLVEDGGYLAPLLNRFALEGKAVGEVFAHFHALPPAGEEQIPFSEWLAGTFLGSVEHTRNGYDYNVEIVQEFGRLQFPAASIAVSSLKRGREARECAVSILNAVESILHRLGLLLSKRRILLLGSSGAIGGFLKQELRHRLDPGQLFGVDLAVREGKSGAGIMEVPTLEALERETLHGIDLVIGVIGASILKEDLLDEILLRGRQKEIFFASGSTKTVEFADLEVCLQSLRDAEDPRLAGERVRVDFSTLRDLQTGVLQGNRVLVSFPDDPSRDKTLYLLGELMPINFLYYGIPREIVDEVMAQLFTVSCGLVRRQRSPGETPSRILAVDHQIDADANPLGSER